MIIDLELQYANTRETEITSGPTAPTQHLGSREEFRLLNQPWMHTRERGSSLLSFKKKNKKYAGSVLGIRSVAVRRCSGYPFRKNLWKHAWSPLG